MRPTDLKSNYTFKDRRVYINDSVFYVPVFYNYTDFEFPGWEAIFQNQNPVNIEYCSGNGDWIAAKAQEFPHINWVAVEINFERARKIWSKLKNNNLQNLFIVCGDGRVVTKHYFPKESIQNVFINFPDPWPKNSHAKHRIMQGEFLQELYECMAQGAAFTLVTDDEDYSKRSIALMKKIDLFHSVFFLNEYPEYGTSYFEELFRAQGKQIHYHQWTKKNH